MPEKKRAIIADHFIDTFRDCEDLLVRFVRLWEGQLDLDALGKEPDFLQFKKWLGMRQDGVWSEMIENLCEVHQLCSEIGHGCLLCTRQHARVGDLDVDTRTPVAKLSLGTRIERPDLFYQAYDRNSFHKAEKFTVYQAPGAGAIGDPDGAARRLAASLSEHHKIDQSSERIRVRHYRELRRDHFVIHHERRLSAEIVLHGECPQVRDAQIFHPAHVDLIIYHSASGQLEIETKYAKGERVVRRFFAQTCFGDPDLFEPSAKAGCFHLSRLAEPDFAMTVNSPDKVYLGELHFEVRSASELDRDDACFVIRGQNVLKMLDRFALRQAMDPGTTRRAVFRFHFAGSGSERPVTILGANKISFNHIGHQDEIYRYLRQWGVMA